MKKFSIADPDSSSLGPVPVILLLAVVISGVVWMLHGPAVSLALTGDAYQWVQHAHRAAHEPALLLTDLDDFFRPSATWLLVIDRVVWGGFDAAGYRTTSLVLHGLSALLLAVAGRRLGLGWPAASLVALVWLTSPFTDESVFVVACRHEVLLLIPWLVLISVWPRSNEPWRASRLIGAAVAIVWAAAAKETWVVTPLLVAALEFERSKSVRGTVIPTATVSVLVTLYLAIHLVMFQSSRGYLEFGPHVLAKIPNQAAAFLFLAEPMVDTFWIDWTGVLALVIVAGIVVMCLRRGVRGSLVATCVLIAPSVPTLMIPFMPQRYLTIPFAGFVLLVALWLSDSVERFPRWRGALRFGIGMAVGLVVAAGAALTRADLEDYRFVADAHAELLEETAAIIPTLQHGSMLAVVRDEQRSPLHEMTASPVGLPKIAFVRSFDPYGLIDTAALFEWVLAEEGTRVEYVTDWRSSALGSEGGVLAHRDGGFSDLGRAVDLAAEIDRWISTGRPVQCIRRIEFPGREAVRE